MLEKLQNIYLSQCNGDWEHSFGVQIDTLDNPGWWFTFDLQDTPLMGVTFERTSIERNASNWVQYESTGNKFEGACGVQNLSELITIFARWWEENLGDDCSN